MRIYMRGAVNRDFRPYIRRYTSLNGNFKYSYNLIMYMLLIGLVVRYLSLLDGSNKGQCINNSSMWVSVHQSLVYQILKTYAAISNAQLSRVCKRGKLSGSCLSTHYGFGSTQLPIFLCHIRVPTFSSQNN